MMMEVAAKYHCQTCGKLKHPSIIIFRVVA
mgnify:CR=1 FL=1